MDAEADSVPDSFLVDGNWLATIDECVSLSARCAPVFPIGRGASSREDWRPGGEKWVLARPIEPAPASGTRLHKVNLIHRRTAATARPVACNHRVSYPY